MLLIPILEWVSPAQNFDHHLAAVFAKLDVDTPLDAIRSAERAGLDPNGQRMGNDSAKIGKPADTAPPDAGKLLLDGTPAG